MEAFKSGKVPLLIATDVAARGLDIPDVEVGTHTHTHTHDTDINAQWGTLGMQSPVMT